MTDEGRTLPNRERIGDEPVPPDDGDILVDPRHGGIPGDEAGRRVAAGGGGVFPASAGWPEDDMDLRKGEPDPTGESNEALGIPPEGGD